MCVGGEFEEILNAIIAVRAASKSYPTSKVPSVGKTQSVEFIDPFRFTGNMHVGGATNPCMIGLQCIVTYTRSFIPTFTTRIPHVNPSSRSLNIEKEKEKARTRQSYVPINKNVSVILTRTVGSDWPPCIVLQSS